MFLYSSILGFVVDDISMEHHIDAVVGELVQPFVELIITGDWFWI